MDLCILSCKSFLECPPTSSHANIRSSYDVEQEVNGLYSYGRKAKIPAEKVKAIIDGAQAYYYAHVAPKEAALENGH